MQKGPCLLLDPVGDIQSRSNEWSCNVICISLACYLCRSGEHYLCIRPLRFRVVVLVVKLELIPMHTAHGEVTMLLQAMTGGDESAAEKLLPLVYKELHRLAKSYMRRERPDHTLQPTALINEAYMRLARDEVDWQGRQHFIAVAANVMRHVLVDYARAHQADMRGGRLQRVELNEDFVISEKYSKEVLALHEALKHLEKLNPRQAKVVELRYFAGLSLEEIAGILKISTRSVKRDWSLARIWLFKEIQNPPDFYRVSEEDM
jgi:RNA polymerase sigma-70 factor, ECF subfamily